MRVVRTPADPLMDLRWRVLREGRPRRTAAMPGDDAPTTRHWALEDDGVVLACVTVMAEPWPEGDGPAWRLRGMAVDAGRQREGLGSQLLGAVHDDVAAPMWCDARLHAIPFYQAHGWDVRTDVFDVPHVGPHRRMIWPGP